MYSSFWLYFAGAIWVYLIYYFLRKYSKTEIDYEEAGSYDRKGFYLLGAFIVFILGIIFIGQLFPSLQAPYIFD